MSNRSNLYEQFFDQVKRNIASMSSEDRLLIVGDINLSEIVWTLGSDGYLEHNNPVSTDATELTNLMSYGNLKQFNGVQNFRSEILDLVLSNDHRSIVNVDRSNQSLVDEDPYHPTIDITINAPIPTPTMDSNESYKKLNFWKANYDDICIELESIDWSSLDRLELTQALSEFYQIVNEIISKHTPQVKKKGKFPFW